MQPGALVPTSRLPIAFQLSACRKRVGNRRVWQCMQRHCLTATAGSSRCCRPSAAARLPPNRHALSGAALLSAAARRGCLQLQVAENSAAVCLAGRAPGYPLSSALLPAGPRATHRLLGCVAKFQLLADTGRLPCGTGGAGGLLWPENWLLVLLPLATALLVCFQLPRPQMRGRVCLLPCGPLPGRAGKRQLALLLVWLPPVLAGRVTPLVLPQKLAAMADTRRKSTPGGANPPLGAGVPTCNNSSRNCLHKNRQTHTTTTDFTD